jgi:hypothetical protein
MADHDRQTAVDEVQEDSEDCGILGDAQDNTSAPPTATSSKVDIRSQNALKLERQLTWARGLTLQDVTLTNNKQDVDTLGPLKWSTLKMKVKEAFLKANKIQIAQLLRSSENLGKNVANHINSNGYKDVIKAPLRKKNASSKPDCIKKDGTLYRCVNVIMSKRNEFMELKKSHDKDDSDSRNPKPLAWESMHHLYDSDDEELLVLSSSPAQSLLGFSVPANICADYDHLDLPEFKAVINFIVAIYRECRNKKSVSGEHQQFGAYVGGRAYILYFYECLQETGDTALMNCAYAELNDNVKRTSTDATKRRVKRGSSNASERSLSPMPSGFGFRSQKQSAVAATEDAANAIASRHHAITHNDRFDRMIELSDRYDRESTAATHYKQKYKQGKRRGISDNDLSKIELKYKRAKKRSKIFFSEYNKLKSDLGYQSPDESDGSLLSSASDSTTKKNEADRDSSDSSDDS